MVSIKGAAYQLVFVQCSSCGSVVGVLEAANAGAALESIGRVVDAIARKVGAI